MKRKLLSVLISAGFLFGLSPVYMPANVHAEDTTVIANLTDLTSFAAAVNNGDTFAGKTVVLSADISLSGEWTPIGDASRSGKVLADGSHSFAGTFDGQNHIISGLTITAGTAEKALGLFGAVNGGTVKNLKLTEVSISAADNENTGAVCGILLGGGTIDNCEVSGSVSAYNCGGIVGRMLVSGTISDCKNHAAVTGTSTKQNSNAGGIVCKAYYTEREKEMNIRSCINDGAVSGNYSAGGIVGLSAANVFNCQNSGTVYAATVGGGIVGEQKDYGEIKNNTNTGSISGGNIGGIVGWIRYMTTENESYQNREVISITSNNNTGSVISSSGNLGSGGIVGNIYNAASVTDNSNSASAINGYAFAAGIAGNLQLDSANEYMDAAYTKEVKNNFTSTPKGSITVASGTCTHLIAYNNPGTFTVSDNTLTAGTNQIAVVTNPADESVALHNPDDKTLSADASAVFGAVTYQWQKSSDNASFADISGETQNTLLIPAETAGVTYYRCVFSSVGASSAVSSSAAVTVKAIFNVNGTITSDTKPTEAYLLCNGVKYAVTVSGETNPYPYQSVYVEPGIYDLVVTANGVTRTALVEVTSQNMTQNVTMPTKALNSEVKETGTDTPHVEVGGLDTIADTLGTSNETTQVVIKLTVKKNDSSEHASEVKESIDKDPDNLVTGMILDVDLTKQVNDGNSENIAEVSTETYGTNLIMVVIHLPAALQGKEGYALFRYHGTSVDKITETANADGEKIVLSDDGKTMTAHLKKFSTYAIAYKEKVKETSSSSSKETSSQFLVTFLDSKGNTVKIEWVDSGKDATPPTGYGTYTGYTNVTSHRDLYPNTGYTAPNTADRNS